MNFLLLTIAILIENGCDSEFILHLTRSNPFKNPRALLKTKQMFPKDSKVC